MSIVFACLACGSPAITPPKVLDDEANVHCGRCGAVVGQWGPFKALARYVERSQQDEAPGRLLGRPSADPAPDAA